MHVQTIEQLFVILQIGFATFTEISIVSNIEMNKKFEKTWIAIIGGIAQ